MIDNALWNQLLSKAVGLNTMEIVNQEWYEEQGPPVFWWSLINP